GAEHRRLADTARAVKDSQRRAEQGRNDETGLPLPPEEESCCFLVKGLETAIRTVEVSTDALKEPGHSIARGHGAAPALAPLLAWPCASSSFRNSASVRPSYTSTPRANQRRCSTGFTNVSIAHERNLGYSRYAWRLFSSTRRFQSYKP